MAKDERFDVFRFRDSGEDDGRRMEDEKGYLICNRCRTRMHISYNEEEGVEYGICPKCGFIEIQHYDYEYDENDAEDYELYWPGEDEEFDPYTED